VRTAATYRNAAAKAQSRLLRHGLCPVGMGEEAIDRLQNIACHLDTTDPMEIGAGALLETSGYERSQVQLSLESAA
jgi:hypothetical protein